MTRSGFVDTSLRCVLTALTTLAVARDKAELDRKKYELEVMERSRRALAAAKSRERFLFQSHHWRPLSCILVRDCVASRLMSCSSVHSRWICDA